MIVLMDGDHSADSDFPIFESMPSVYAIAAIPRSGSNLVSKTLWKTGIAGAPLEYFEQRIISDFQQRWGRISMDAYRAKLVRHRSSPNGIFGFKTHWENLQRFSNHPNSATFSDLLLPARIIYTKRLDKIRQAVSWVRALQTRQFTSIMGAQLPAHYDHGKILMALKFIERDEREWERYLSSISVSTMTVEYETLTNSFPVTISRVADFLGLHISPQQVPTAPIQRLADAETEEWVIRFQDDQQRSKKQTI